MNAVEGNGEISVHLSESLLKTKNRPVKGYTVQPRNMSIDLQREKNKNPEQGSGETQHTAKSVPAAHINQSSSQVLRTGYKGRSSFQQNQTRCQRLGKKLLFLFFRQGVS